MELLFTTIIYRKSTWKGRGPALYLEDAAFETVAEFIDSHETLRMGAGFRTMKVTSVPIRERTQTNVYCRAGDPLLEELVGMLEELGWKAFMGHCPPELAQDHYSYVVKRLLDENDIQDCAYLHLTSFLGFSSLDWAGFDGETPLAAVDSIYDEDSGEPLKGSILGLNRFVVSDQIQKCLLEESFRGLEFREIGWDEPARSVKRYWEIVSNLDLPPCKTPVIDLALSGVLAYASGDGIEPPFLRFSREEFQKLGAFDIATLHERIGNGKEWCKPHQMVISNKFWKTLCANGIEVAAIPIELE